MRRRHRSLLPILLSALLIVALLPRAHACRPFGSYDFVEDGEGNIWFTEQDGNAVSRLAKDGSVSAYLIPTPNAEPTSLALDESGNLWFSATHAGRLGRVAPDGRVKEYALPFDAEPYAVLPQEGGLWFTTGPVRRTVVLMDAEGAFTEMPAPHGWPSSITADREGLLWVTLLQPGKTPEEAKGYLARLSRSGEWTMVEERGAGSCPNNLHIGENGARWLTDRCRGEIERRDAEGQTTRIPYPDGMVQKADLDREGRFWFVDSTRNLIGRISPRGGLDTWPLPGDNGGPFAVAALRNGEVIFSEMYNYNINRLTPAGVFEEYLVATDHREAVKTVTKGEVCRLEYAAVIAGKKALERERLEALKTARFKEGAGLALVRQRCLTCHGATRILRARKSDWGFTIDMMQAQMSMRGVPPLNDEERLTVTGYLNRHYNTTN